MNSADLKVYIAHNSKVEVIFKGKATDYLVSKNKRRQPAKRWNETRIERQTDKMYDEVIDNAYSKLHGAIKDVRYADKSKWVSFINKNEVLDGLEESMSELEFEE